LPCGFARRQGILHQLRHRNADRWQSWYMAILCPSANVVHLFESFDICWQNRHVELFIDQTCPIIHWLNMSNYSLTRHLQLYLNHVLSVRKSVSSSCCLSSHFPMNKAFCINKYPCLVREQMRACTSCFFLHLLTDKPFRMSQWQFFICEQICVFFFPFWPLHNFAQTRHPVQANGNALSVSKCVRCSILRSVFGSWLNLGDNSSFWVFSHSALQHTASHCKTLHHTATNCTTLHRTATTHCNNSLQHTATDLPCDIAGVSNFFTQHACSSGYACSGCRSWNYMYMYYIYFYVCVCLWVLCICI